MSAAAGLLAEARHPVGFANTARYQPMASDGPRGTLLHKLYLLPTETGHGYGEQIFSAVEARAKAAGDDWLWLEVLASNPGANVFMSVQVCNM